MGENRPPPPLPPTSRLLTAWRARHLRFQGGTAGARRAWRSCSRWGTAGRPCGWGCWCCRWCRRCTMRQRRPRWCRQSRAWAGGCQPSRNTRAGTGCRTGTPWRWRSSPTSKLRTAWRGGKGGMVRGHTGAHAPPPTTTTTRPALTRARGGAKVRKRAGGARHGRCCGGGTREPAGARHAVHRPRGGGVGAGGAGGARRLAPHGEGALLARRRGDEGGGGGGWRAAPA
jgi:hypothetical protein